MLRHSHMLLPMLAAAVAGFFAGKKDPITIPLFDNHSSPLVHRASCSSGSYGSMNYGEIEQVRRNNRRGKIIRRYR